MANLIQATISTIGFPKTLDQLEHFLEIDEPSGKVEGSATDIDLLLTFNPKLDRDFTWTAPRWIVQGDILFFYHTKSTRRSIAKLLKEANGRVQELGGRRGWRLWGEASRKRARLSEMVALLEHAADLAKSYSGTIFGCAEVFARTKYSPLEGDLHFSTKFFAPLGQVHLFEHPLPAEDFAEYVKIGQSTQNTPLYDTQFEGIKARLAERNDLPDYLRRARIGGHSLRDATPENWPENSCSSEARFVNEAQLREYLLDFLLEELKDPRSPVLKECQCFRKGTSTGFADYFVKVNEDWIPVEAKLTVLGATPDKLLDQVARYVNIDSFIPTLGRNRGTKYAATGSPPCLICDQAGIYIVSEGKFRDCSPGQPIWKREELDHSTKTEVRRRLEEEGRRHG